MRPDDPYFVGCVVGFRCLHTEKAMLMAFSEVCPKKLKALASERPKQFKVLRSS